MLKSFLIAKNNEVIGLIHLKDIIKPMIKDKFKELNLMGIKTIMCTGDNNLTAKVIAKEASNMIDLDSDPTKIIAVIKVGRQLLMTRGALATFSITNDISKYFAILPSIFPIKGLETLNLMHLQSGHSAIVSTLIFSALLIPAGTPLALSGVTNKTSDPNKHLQHNILQYGLGGMIIPFLGIKLIDLIVGRFIP